MDAPRPAPRAGPAPKPLIVTLALEPEAQARFEAERRRHYPAKLNRIPAHISLFHALPGEELPAVEAALRAAASETPRFEIEVHDLMRLGKGVAYKVRAPEFAELHGRLRAAWLPWLTPQDLQPFRPHIVIQNKAEPEAARALYERLGGGFRPETARAASLRLWHYEGGPWTAAGEFPLGGPV